MHVHLHLNLTSSNIILLTDFLYSHAAWSARLGQDMVKSGVYLKISPAGSDPAFIIRLCLERWQRARGRSYPELRRYKKKGRCRNDYVGGYVFRNPGIARSAHLHITFKGIAPYDQMDRRRSECRNDHVECHQTAFRSGALHESHTLWKYNRMGVHDEKAPRMHQQQLIYF